MAKQFEFIFPVDEEVTDRDGKKVLWTLDKILSVVDTHNCKYIISRHPIDKESSFEHWHVGIHTESNNEYDTIARWFNMPTFACQKIRKRFETTYALYLAHYNQGEKTEIDPSTIIRNFELDYDKLIKNIENKVVDDEVLDKVANGQTTEYDLYRTMSAQWLRKHKRDIDIALQVRSKRNMAKGNERKMEVVYITGEARSGKSYLAKKLAKDGKMSLYIASNGANPFDDYMGQEAVLLDDIRPSDFKFSELLKVLDNHMSAKVSARYHNIDLNCKIMYLTTTMTMADFYKNVRESDGEATQQLQGRIHTMINVSKDKVSLYYLEKDNTTYRHIATIPNPILTDEEINLMSDDERREKAIEIMGGLGDMFKNTAEYLTDSEVPKGFTPIEDGDQITF